MPEGPDEIQTRLAAESAARREQQLAREAEARDRVARQKAEKQSKKSSAERAKATRAKAEMAKRRERLKEADKPNLLDVKPADVPQLSIAPVIPERKQPELGYGDEERLRRLMGEMVRRGAESLRLYEPLPEQAAFHACMAPERILRGSNRSGKTLAHMVEIARAVTGTDPYGKYPVKDGHWMIVGKDGDHMADPIWKMMSRAGSFKMIRDKDTGLWRAYRPWDEKDWERRAEAKKAPPLLPNRWIKSIAWENKKLNQPALVNLVTGWTIDFRSSKGEAPQGFVADGISFDEEIIGENWYGESAMRLMDRSGRFIWSATPQASTQALYDLSCRAADEVASEKPSIVEFLCLLRNNPHISSEEKKKVAAKLSPEEYRVRIDGEFRLLAEKVYPEFHQSMHVCESFVIPEEWTRVAAVDPGHQVCAALFCAIPPPDDPEHGDYVYFYEEMYLKAASATTFGSEFAKRVQNHDFYIYLIDGQAGQMSDMGSGMTVQAQYVKALEENKVGSRLQGAEFTRGSNDPKGGILMFREWLRTRQDGTARLRVFRECQNYLTEIERYRYKRVAGFMTDDPIKKNDHLMDTARYLAAFDPQYVPPVAKKRAESYAVRYLKQKKKDKREKSRAMGGGHVSLGPRR